MDVSPEYIKMCEKAMEIQQIWLKPTLALYPVFVFNTKSKKVHLIVSIPDSFADFVNGKQVPHPNTLELPVTYPYDSKLDISIKDEQDCIWLPRQDQLQEMMLGRKYGIWDLFGKFGNWCSEWSERRYSAGYFNTGEQLWLAFVMKDNNKIWNGEDWVKE